MEERRLDVTVRAMEERRLDVTVLSAEDLKVPKVVKLLSKMKVYAAVSLGEDPKAVSMTRIDPRGRRNPQWNNRITFVVKATTVERNPGLQLVFKLRAVRPPLGDKTVGVVSVPFKDLLDSAPGSDEDEVVVVKNVRNALKGTLAFSNKLGENVASRRSPFPGSGASSPHRRLLSGSGASSPHRLLGVSNSTVYYKSPPPQRAQQPQQGLGMAGLAGMVAANVLGVQ